MNSGFALLSRDGQTYQFSPEEWEEKEIFQYQLVDYVVTEMNHRDILKGKEVLDISCGKGGSTNFLLHHLNAKRAVGIDFSKKQVEMCDDLFG